MSHIVSNLLAVAHGFVSAGNPASTCVSKVNAAAKPLDILLVQHRWEMP